MASVSSLTVSIRSRVNTEEDRSDFNHRFQESLRTREKLLSYVRLKRKSQSTDYDSKPQEVLFELKGRPYFIANQKNDICFFAVASPHPSRNTAMQVLFSMDDYDVLIRGSRLNTLLELKAENAQLQQHIVDLRKDTSSPTHSPPSPSMVSPRNSSCPTPNSIPQRRSTDDYPSTGSGASVANGHSGTMPCPVNSSLEGGNSAPHRILHSASADEESSEERTKKKVLSA